MFTEYLTFVFACSRVSKNGSPGGDDSPGGADKKRLRRFSNSKAFKICFTFAAKIPLLSISKALQGTESESTQEALRVLDIILRQHAAKQ